MRNMHYMQNKSIAMVFVVVFIIGIIICSSANAELQINVDNNEEIFGLFALANVGGYEYEVESSFSEPRKAASDYLASYRDKCGKQIADFKELTKVVS